MTTFIFIVIALIITHVIYENVIAPSLRANLHYKLFAIRDELRWLKYNNPEELSDNVYDCVQQSLNVTTRFLKFFDAAALFKSFRELKQDQKLTKQIEKRKKLIESCKLKEFTNINQRIGKILLYSLMVNSGMLMLYVIPLVVFFIATAEISHLVIKVVLIPEKYIDRIVMPSGLAHTH